MADYKSEVQMSVEDAASILYNIEKGIKACEYVTGNIVMAMIEMSSVAFLRGKGVYLDDPKELKMRRELCLAFLNALFSFAMHHKDTYEWFIRWVEKVQERQEELVTLFDFEEVDDESDE